MNTLSEPRLPRLARWQAAWHWLTDLDPLEVLPPLTVVILLLRAPNVWYLQVPLTMLCVLGLVYRSTLKTTHFWYVAATLVGTTIYFNWESADNHKYLICYWCLALCCAFSLPRRMQATALSLSSRWLIGLCMIWAVLWKLSAAYLDGSFFQFTLLVDARFDHFARALAGVSPVVLADNRQLHELLLNGHLRGLPTESVSLSDTWQVSRLAGALTWWTILIEAALAIAFLLPWQRLRKLRHAMLLLFGITTYAVAPVVGFGWMLMLLGMAQCKPTERGWKLGYLAVFLLIQAYALPIGDLLQLLAQTVSGTSGCG